MRILIAIVVLFCSLAGSLPAQGMDSLLLEVKQIRSNFQGNRKDKKRINKAFKAVADSLELQSRKSDLEAKMAAAGYPEFTIDSLFIKGKTLHLDIHQGPYYAVDSIALNGLSEAGSMRSGYHKMEGGPLDLAHIEEVLKRSLRNYQNHGYPFAKFDSLSTDFTLTHRDSVAAMITYQFDPGKLVRIDSIRIRGEKRENDSFVYSVIGLRPGAIFDQQAISETPRQLNNSIYFKNVKPVKVTFTDKEKANLDIDLESRKAGKFDLLLGILPPRDDDQRLQFTGLIDFQLVSPLFRAGEILELRYDKLPGTSSKLRLGYQQPYIFGTPIRFSGELNILKQDTVFLTRSLRAMGGYDFGRNLSLRLSFRSKSSNLISTLAYERDSTLMPPVLDGRDQTYSLGFAFNTLDYRFNPRKGWWISADIGLGRKKIVQNPRLFEGVYQGLKLVLPKREAVFELAWYRALGKRLVFKLGNSTYWLDQDQYFENDLLQVGGSRTLRGFNENQFFTDIYTQFTVEPRFILEQNSYLFVFTDYAYLQNQTGTDRILRPWGLGLGMTYETKAGMVSVTYAVGKAGDFGFQPSRGRIHIGLINQF